MYKLTAKEEEVMEHIWTLGACAPKDVVALYPEDERPHINSIANAFQSLEKKGYLSLDKAVHEKKKLKAGDKVYLNQMNKAVVAFHIGKEPLENGMNIVGAHIDSPRIDLKQNPF